MQAQGAANAARIPGAMGLESQSSGNIRNALSGQLPADVINQIGQRSAERGVMTGNPYGASTSADYLKAIGLNSLQMMGTGQDWLSAALGSKSRCPYFRSFKANHDSRTGRRICIEQGQSSVEPAASQHGHLEHECQIGEFEAASQNARNQMEVENSNAQRKLQSDLANASNQLERDRLVWQFEQNRLAAGAGVATCCYWISTKESGWRWWRKLRWRWILTKRWRWRWQFAPATNWSGGPTPITQPWHLPYSLDQGCYKLS